MEKRSSFILHFDSLDVLEELSKEQIADLFIAIRDYNLGNEVILSGLMKAVFIPFKNQFDRDLEKYKDRCEINKNNGKKGGRPRIVEENPVGYLETQENQSKPKKPYNDNDSDSKNDNDNDSNYFENKGTNKQINNNIVVSKETTLQDYIKKEFTIDFLTEIYNKYNLDKEIFKEECEAFVGYWTETNINGSKEKWQKEKTFDPKLRFRQWMKNTNRWTKPNLYNKPKGIGQLLD